MAKYAIEESTLTGIADAVRKMRDEKGPMTPAQIEAKIRASRLGIPIVVTNHVVDGVWVRPSEYPDLDALAATIGATEDCVYFTYDLRKTPGYGWIGQYAEPDSNSSKWYVERGHVSAGAFVVDESNELTGSVYFRQALDSTKGDIQTWRVKTNGYFKRLRYATNSNTSSECYACGMQPCVESAGNLLHLTSFSTDLATSANYNTHTNATMWIERDGIKRAGIITRMDYAFNNAFSLQSLDTQKWDTTNWTITTLKQCWTNCYLLQELDFTGWDTSNWVVADISSCWNGCYSLKSLDLSGWDTSNWVLNTIAYCWYFCTALQSLDLSGWDTSNWAVTTLYACWNNCYSLQFLDISTWDTSNWAVTTLYSCWSNCRSLRYLDLSNWDTSNWTVATLASCWNTCSSLQFLDISTWDTSNWAVTTLATCWNSCYSLRFLDISDWDTGNWGVTTISDCWNNCFSLQSLDLSGWDTSNWAVTTLSGTWYNCNSLKSLDVSNWDTSKWVVTSLSNCWYNCYSIKSLDLTDWDTSGWAVTTFGNCWYYCYSLKFLDISTWDTSNWAVTGANNLFGYLISARTISTPADLGIANINVTPNHNSLENFTGYKLSVNHKYDQAYKLTRASLNSIISRLPTVTGSKTITLGKVNKLKLTSAEIAVATQKGWTVA